MKRAQVDLLSLLGLAVAFGLAVTAATPSATWAEQTQRNALLRRQASAPATSGASSSDKSDNATGSSSGNDSWTLHVTTLNQSSFTAQPYVANGYIGARLPAAGVGFQSFAANESDPELLGQGWPLFGPRVTGSLVAGFYDVQNDTLGTNFPQNGGEQVISLLPSWPALYVTLKPTGSSNNTTNNDTSSEATYGPGVIDSEIRSWTQSMSIRDGTVTTKVDWAPALLGSNNSVSLQYTVFAHRSRPTLGMMRVNVSGVPPGIDVVVTDALDGQGAARTQNGKAGSVTDDGESSSSSANRTIYSSVQPMGLANVTAFLFSALALNGTGDGNATTLPSSVGKLIDANDSATASQSFTLSGQRSAFTAWKVVGIASTDAFGDGAQRIAQGTTTDARRMSWEELSDEHKQAWEAIWDDGGDIVIHGAESEDDSLGFLAQLQTQARASLFHLLSNVRSGRESNGLGDNSIAPAGLTSDSYAASIFWDAETFMFPTLALLYPSFAESILNYRHRDMEQLERNAQQYGKPGILNPWVSARYQNCTGIGPCYDYEYHLNNDIALTHAQYYQQTRNQTFLETRAWPVLHKVSQFWAAQVTQRNGSAANSTTGGGDQASILGRGMYETLNLTDPDEYANFQNNGAFTNAGVTTIMLEALKMADQLGKSTESINAQNWSSIANNLTLLRAPDSNIILEYEGFNATVDVKQADVSLLIYPLEFNDRFPSKQPEPQADLAFYSGATSPNGPGMTYSVYGIASTQLDGNDPKTTTPNCEGFTRLLQAGMPYERQYGQFSEQVDDNVMTNGGTNPAYTFLTGHGGLLQSYTHGFLGYRTRNDSAHTLYIDPNLPPQLAAGGGITVRGVRHGLSRVDVDICADNTTVTHRSGNATITLQAGLRGKTQQLPVGQQVVVATRTVSSMQNVAGTGGGSSNGSSSSSSNYALCRPLDDTVVAAAVSAAQGAPAANDTSAQNAETPSSSSVHAGTNLAQGAIDGSNATYFQPSTTAATSLTIDLGAMRTLSSVHLNWGTVPPQTVSIAVSASNSTSSDDQQQLLVDRMAVNVTQSYDPAAAAIVRLPTGFNTTDIDLSNASASADDANNGTSTSPASGGGGNATSSGSVRARYVNVTMEGVADPQEGGYGATLVEFVLR